MVQFDEALKSNSTVIRLWRHLKTVGPQWMESSSCFRIAQQLDLIESTHTDETTTEADESTADASGTHSEENPAAEPPGGSDEPTVSPEPTDHSAADARADGVDTQESSEPSVYSTALSYRLIRHVRSFVELSWLYRWLTAEPDAEVVVIDLRETLSAGPILAQIDQRIRDFISVMPTSGGLRRGYRLQKGFREHPIRVASFGLLGVILLGFIGVVAAGGPLGIATFVLIIGLLVATRGTQNRTPLSEITDSGWYQVLADTFEPPSPPESSDSDPNNAHSRSIESTNDDSTRRPN